jgi:hypothetical protein
MTSQELCKIIHDTLYNILPNDIINTLILRYVTNYYKYKYTFDTDVAYYNVHFNKSLNVICCVGINSCKFINYHDGKIHNSSLIDINAFESQFITLKLNEFYMDSIIHFDNDIILINAHPYWRKYVLNDKKYVMDGRINLISKYLGSCVYNQYIYIYKLCYASSYHIMICDMKDLRQIKLSNEYDFICDYDSYPNVQMTIYENRMYALHQSSIEAFEIYIHDVNTLNKIEARKFEYKRLIHCMTIHKNELYTYNHNDNQIYVYDISTVHQIHKFERGDNEGDLSTKFEVRKFKSHNSKYKMMVSDDILILTNGSEMMVYDGV